MTKELNPFLGEIKTDVKTIKTSTKIDGDSTKNTNSLFDNMLLDVNEESNLDKQKIQTKDNNLTQKNTQVENKEPKQIKKKLLKVNFKKLGKRHMRRDLAKGHLRR